MKLKNMEKMKLQAIIFLLASLLSNSLVDANNHQHKVTLHKAAEEGNLDVVRYWTKKDPTSFNKTINYGLFPHIRGATPLHISAERGHLDVVKYLIEKNPASVDITDGGRKRTPLYWAAYQGHLKVIKYLVEEGGANVSSKDVGGDTPLHIGAGLGYLEVVKYLSKKNPAGVNITNNLGQTPQHVVAGPLYRGPHNVTKYSSVLNKNPGFLFGTLAWTKFQFLLKSTVLVLDCSNFGFGVFNSTLNKLRYLARVLLS